MIDRPVTELLPTDTHLEHQSAGCDDEHRHAFVVPAFGFGIPASTAGTGTRTGSGCGRLGTGGDDGGVYLPAELEIPLGELPEGSLVLKEDDLGVSLSSDLKAHRELGQRGFTDRVTGDVVIDNSLVLPERATEG